MKYKIIENDLTPGKLINQMSPLVYK